MKTLILTALLALTSTLVFSQSVDSTYAVWVDGNWQVQVHPDSVVGKDLTRGPKTAYNMLTGDYFIYNPVDSNWSEASYAGDIAGESTPVYAIGDTIGEGIVFYVDPNHSSDGGVTSTRGLVVALPEHRIDTNWSATQALIPYVDYNASPGPYAGESLTKIILAYQDDAGAAGYCERFAEDGGDWFLPTVRNMITVYNELGSVYADGTSRIYWTSQQENISDARNYVMPASTGSTSVVGSSPKTSTRFVLPIRRF